MSQYWHTQPTSYILFWYQYKRTQATIGCRMQSPNLTPRRSFSNLCPGSYRLRATFSLSPSSKPRETRKWPRGLLKARDRRASCDFGARRSRARALPSLNLKKNCSQFKVLTKWLLLDAFYVPISNKNVCMIVCQYWDTMIQMKCQGHRGEKVCQEPRANWSVCSF